METKARRAGQRPSTEAGRAGRSHRRDRGGDPPGPAALEGLRAYALPLLAEIAAWPRTAVWREWLDKLGDLATRTLSHPDRVLAVLAELAPMADVGPVDLREVRLVLERRLSEIVVRPRGRRFGRVFVATTDEARGLAFDVVFVPGLAEKLFPRRIAEDPVLPDRVRAHTSLPTNTDRGASERLALHLAVGAAKERLVFSFPRLDLEQSRPRTPSFYGLEILRAAEGELPDFDTLSRRANITGAARVGWPAPVDPAVAINYAEHDLALLESVLRRPEAETVGTAHYLLSSNVHLARALRFRGKRWLRKWTDADGLVAPAPAAQRALAAHDLPPLALDYYRRATSLNPGSPFYWMDFASAYDSAGDVAEAEQAFRKARNSTRFRRMRHGGLGTSFCDKAECRKPSTDS